MIMWHRVFAEPSCSLFDSLHPSISLQHLQPRHDSYFFPAGSVLLWHKHPESSEEQAAQLWMAMLKQILFLKNYDSLPEYIFSTLNGCADKRENIAALFVIYMMHF